VPTTAPRLTWKDLLIALAVAVAAMLANLATWQLAHRPVAAPEFHGQVGGFAYSIFQRDQSPLEARYPSEAEIDADLRLLAARGARIRTYASAEQPALPRLAKAHGLDLTAGAWLDRRRENNQAELAALFRAVASYDNIQRVIVGNEAILRSDLTPPQLIGYLDQAREALNVPVSTAEPWHVWLKYPELAEHVDYITIHLLPYWEGVPIEHAIDDVLRRYEEVRAAFPGKPVVIGEVGWPTNGDRFERARPSTAGSAEFLRRFFTIADARGLDYYVMEAFDQPWKEAGEGRVGAYWGMYSADREPKFALTGPIQPDPAWLAKAAIAGVLAFGAMVWFGLAFRRFGLAGRLFFAGLIQGAAALLVWSIGVPFDYYLDPLDWAMLALLLPAQLAILAIVLANGFEFVEAIWNRGWQRGATARAEPDRTEWPFVSIHLACHNEPPEMVIATLDSLARLDYPAFEVLVVDNNTDREETWRPVEAHCAALGPRFRFFALKPWPGFKAGALNFALGQTDPRAEVIGVVDADYVVERDWLRALVGHFDDPKVAIVQCPQAHRDWESNPFRRMTNWEYEGFFRIGMHHRNERDAIIQHGTMTLIRRRPLVDTGNWAEWCIVEDAELGLRLFNAGYSAVYVDHVMGRGLTPADYTAYKTQRFRWAFGAMQILRRHWSWLVRPGLLSPGQRYHFLTGWFGWFADALHLVFTGLAIAWTLGLLLHPEAFSLPLKLFLVPVLGFFAVRAVFGIVLYRVRVPCSWADTLRAAVASMGLSHAIARGILKGLATSEHPFTRTAKSRRLRFRPGAFIAVREEGLLLAALLLAIAAVALEFGTRSLEANLWMAILAAQSLPYLSAVACTVVSAFSGERAIVAASAPTRSAELAREPTEPA
jgi:exo-beta-1,3-glucanase (GH17 family)/cellulose synthase/poly-beta-1,6-N-acetylglucosamine synthase-like glycosyltransferase